MKLRLLLLTLFALAGSAAAQFTTVTGTVTDPNGIPYAYGTITPTLSYSGGTPMLNSVPYMQPSQAVNLDKNGSFTMTLADNTVLTPASTKWNFTVCSGAGTVQPAIGNGPVCFSLASAITISGSSQSISSNLNAVALALTNAASTTGTVKSGTSGQLAYYAASGSSVSGSPALSESGNNAIVTGVLSSYNGIATVSNGVPQLVGKADQTAQTATISATTVYAVPSSGGVGSYRAWCYVVSSNTPTGATLPDCRISWTDNDSSVVETVPVSSTEATSAAGTIGYDTAHTLYGMVTFQAKASTNIQYATTGYAAGSGTALQYAVHVKVEYLGN